MKTYLAELKKIIRKEFGKKCKDFQYNCYICNAYFAHELLKRSYKEIK